MVNFKLKCMAQKGFPEYNETVQQKMPINQRRQIP